MEITKLPDTLVLSSGGLKGYLHLGALKVLYNNQHLDNVKNIIGCSVGSVIGLLILVGYDIDEIIESTLSTNILSSFSQIDIFKIRQNMGIIDTKEIKNQLEELVCNKLSYVPTMKELYEFSDINFMVVGSNLTNQSCQIFSHTNYPDVSCIDIILISSNIPGIFYQIKKGQNIYADGGLSNPFPIDVLDDNKHEILGLYIESNEKSFGERGSAWWFFNSIIDFPIKSLVDKNIKNKSTHCKVIKLPGPVYSCLLTCSKEYRMEMIKIGESKARKFINLNPLDNDEQLWINYYHPKISNDLSDKLLDLVVNIFKNELTHFEKIFSKDKSIETKTETEVNNDDYLIDV